MRLLKMLAVMCRVYMYRVTVKKLFSIIWIKNALHSFYKEKLFKHVHSFDPDAEPVDYVRKCIKIGGEVEKHLQRTAQAVENTYLKSVEFYNYLNEVSKNNPWVGDLFENTCDDLGRSIDMQKISLEKIRVMAEESNASYLKTCEESAALLRDYYDCS